LKACEQRAPDYVRLWVQELSALKLELTSAKVALAQYLNALSSEGMKITRQEFELVAGKKK
jgi:hypothetical protein